MLSYIHAYHAGNHADILKHLTISLILEHLTKKDKPFTVFDSHAGSALYSLSDERLTKTGEAENGILRLFSRLNSDEKNLEPLKNTSYVSIVKDYLDKGKYPGSPLIENHFLKNTDSQILSELHPTAFEELKQNFYQHKKDFPTSLDPNIHRRDGYEMLLSLTPPKIKRGLCVIDPSFEEKSDFYKCAETITKIHKKWPVGIIALWYPLLSHRTIETSEMKEAISFALDSSEPKILDATLCVKEPQDMTGLSSLYGSGMLIVNFPYKLDEELKSLLPPICDALEETKGSWSVDLM